MRVRTRAISDDWTHVLWVEVWCDVDRVDPPINLLDATRAKLWRVTVWETDGEGEIDPMGRFLDPVPGYHAVKKAKKIQQETTRMLRQRGYRVKRPRPKTMHEELGGPIWMHADDVDPYRKVPHSTELVV